MKVRAKMQIQEIVVNEWSDLVKFQCVYGGTTNEEDNSFAKSTPSGKMELQIDNPAVRGFFKPGMQVYVDLTVIEPAKT
jgi:hypothetical protein